MALRPLLRQIGLKLPVLGRVVRERDRCREELQSLRLEFLRVTAEREAFEALLHNPSTEQLNSGYCHCCRQRTFFRILGPWLRDEYVCLNCRSIPRQRHLQYVLDTHFKGWENLVVHESSPTNDFLSRWCPRYRSSQYFDGVASGTLMGEVECQNLEQLSLPDASVDIFITQDVFEHVFHPQIAAAEIARVLKPGGAHVFTVPRMRWIPTSEPRATLGVNGIEYLKEESYHGNPVGDGRALVTWDYGADFEALLKTWSGLETTTYETVDRSLGIDGELREVFVSRKG